MSTIGNVAVREDPAAEAIRRRINFIEGANVTITIADDPVNHEIDVTIAAAGGAGTGIDDVFFPHPDPNTNIGPYPALLLADSQNMTARQIFNIPNNYASLDTAVVVLIPAQTGNMRRAVTTNFAALCADEVYNTHPDSIAAGVVAVTINEVECIDILPALTGILGGDIVGIEFTRDAENVADTVTDVYYLGIYIEGTV